MGFASRISRFVAIVIALCTASTTISRSAVSQTSVVPRATMVSTKHLDDEVNQFLEKELAAHLGAIKTLDPVPDRVLGVPTTGEFSWGTFMRSLAAYADTTGKRELAGKDIAKTVGQIGLIEARAGSKTFSQLYAALALRHFGRDL